ncbi:MAG: endonuclease/exonuclease/phosphatase family protein [Devosia sp.]|nr:endonuclease/exonuclease/phosphatase family protein [Devosia sp.]
MLSRAEFRGAMLALGVVLAAVLAITSLSINLPGALLLQSLRFHLIAAGLVLLVLMVLAGARWRGALFALVLAVASAHGGSMVLEYQARRDAPLGAQIAELSLIGFNVLTGNRRAEELVDFLVASSADVAVVMETPGIERLLPRLGEAFPYRIGCERSQSCDISIHSRLPIAGGEIRTMPPFRYERLAIAPVTIDGQALTIVGVHLSKPYFDEASWFELLTLDRALDTIEGPVVLVGDFNAAPWSAPVARMARAQGLAPGPSYPATWPVRLGPLGVPIDNILTRGNARILDLSAGADSFGSNHRALLARIGLYEAP